jgi:hypothetical protein
MDSRELGWEGCVNVRDLGGLVTEDGGRTRWGAVVRGDSPHGLSERGWVALAEHGVRTVVDLRWPEERGTDSFVEFGGSVVYRPVAGDHRSVADEYDERPLAVGESAQARVLSHYLSVLERFQWNVASAVSAVGEAALGGVLVHCTSGKDRTGLVCALLLRLAGVTTIEVAADYAATAANLDLIRARWVAAAPDEATRLLRLGAPLTAPSEVMVRVLESVEARCGDVTGYLLEGGAQPEALKRARERLRERPNAQA